MSGIEQAFQIWNQISPIEYINGRWFVRSTSGKRTVQYDLRWAYACKKSLSDLPETKVYTANQLSEAAGISTKTLKNLVIYTPDSPFIQISDRYFMSIDDYRTLTENHPEAFALIKDYPRKGPEYISGLITFAIKGKYPNKRELIKFVGQNGFEILVKYKVLKSMHTLGHRYSYYYYHMPDKSWLTIDENIMK